MWSSQLPRVIPSQWYSHLHSSISISITDEVNHQSPRRSTVANLSSPRKCPLMTRVPIQREFLVFSKATGTTGPEVGRLEYWHVSRFSWSNSDDRLTRQVSSVLISNQNPALCKHTLKTMSYNRLELCSANVIVIVSLTDWLTDLLTDKEVATHDHLEEYERHPLPLPLQINVWLYPEFDEHWMCGVFMWSSVKPVLLL